MLLIRISWFAHTPKNGSVSSSDIEMSVVDRKLSNRQISCSRNGCGQVRFNDQSLTENSKR